jgi:transcriptional regulator with XRE-family HTH domain
MNLALLSPPDCHRERDEKGVVPGFSSEPFCAALCQLKDERGLSFRQLGYMTDLSAGYLNHLSKGTRPVPSNGMLERIARALHVEPAYFKEYRQRYVMDALSASPELLSAVYEALRESPADTGPLSFSYAPSSRGR